MDLCLFYSSPLLGLEFLSGDCCSSLQELLQDRDGVCNRHRTGMGYELGKGQGLDNYKQKDREV